VVNFLSFSLLFVRKYVKIPPCLRESKDNQIEDPEGTKPQYAIGYTRWKSTNNELRTINNEPSNSLYSKALTTKYELRILTYEKINFLCKTKPNKPKQSQTNRRSRGDPNKSKIPRGANFWAQKTPRPKPTRGEAQLSGRPWLRGTQDTSRI